MELIRRKILLEDLTSRKPGVLYGTITASSIYIKVMLTQNMDNMGLFSDSDYIEKIDGTAIKPYNYYSEGGIISGLTGSRLSEVKTYNRNTPYVVDLDVDTSTYFNYKGIEINGVTRVTNLNGPTGYTFDSEDNTYIGTTGQTTGILYNDYESIREIVNQDTNQIKLIPLTEVQFKSEGWNETNTSLSGLTKEEVYLGIVFPPKVESDVFIDRGSVSILEPHLRLSEIESVEHLEIYKNSYYNLIK